MFDVDAAQATIAQAQDAIAELVNMTGGNLKGLVPEPSQLSLPSVTTGSDLAHRMPGSRLVDAVAFACDGEPFVVSVHERDPAARRGG
jgi:chemotaxis protein CheX